MKSHGSKIIIIALLLIITASAAEAVTFVGKRTQRIYFGINLPYTQFGGDFGGDSYLKTTTEAFIIPDIEGGMGIGFTFGFTSLIKKRLGYGLEFYYYNTNHTSKWLSWEDDTRASVLNFDFRLIYGGTPFEPFFSLGVALPHLTVQQDAVDVSQLNPPLDLVSSKIRYRGLGLNIGGGLEYLPVDFLALTGRITYRWSIMNRVKGGGIKYEIGDQLNSSGILLQMGLLYIIPWQ